MQYGPERELVYKSDCLSDALVAYFRNRAEGETVMLIPNLTSSEV